MKEEFFEGIVRVNRNLESFNKKINKHYFSLILFLIISPVTIGQRVEEILPPRNIPELRQAIIKVLQETNTPAAGIALVDSTGPVWIEGLGIADIEKGIEADTETMFRIASTSKIFVALAILKLQEQGKVSLKDRVRDLVPEIEFKNPWEATHPILVEHLLEHTTGWDEIHLVEKILIDPGISLKEGLDFHPHSRISKWVPGTRMAYCNSGPAVAAYIVEKITGQAFENYIRENFFFPLGIETMTYFLSEDYQKKGAKLYKNGNPLEYRYFSLRPSGTLNASPKDMARVLQLFIQRGTVNSTQIISENSLKRMETPSTTLGARAGLKYGYGLGLYTSSYKGFTYYKHGGGIDGAKSDFSYLPEYGLGYTVQINADYVIAIRKISSLIREYQIQHLAKVEKKIPSVKSVHKNDRLNGYYQTINPVKQASYYLPPLLPERIWAEGDTIYNQIPAHFGKIVKFVPVDKGLYHNLITGRTDFVVVNDPLEGEVLELAGTESGTVTLGSIPGAVVFGRIAVLILWIIFFLRGFLLMPFWAYHFWKGKIPGGANILIRIWPLLPAVLLFLVFGLLAVGSLEGKESLAHPNLISISVMIGTIAFFVSAIFSFVMSISYKNKTIKRSIYLPAIFLSLLHSLVAFYFLWHGLIGLRTWA